jgi:MipA family protein
MHLYIIEFNKCVLILCALLVFSKAGNVSAEENTDFIELGIGLSYFQVPHYLGSNQSEKYIIPYPHIRFQSKYLSIDRAVVQAHLSESDIFQLDVSFNGALKVDSDDNLLRQGMPDLDYILEAGPSFNWLLYGSFAAKNKITFDFPVRSVVATDVSAIDAIGWRLEPTLHWFKEWTKDFHWEMDQQLRLLYASEDYHDYFYSVDTAFVNASRSFFDAKDGYGGWQYRLKLKARHNNRILGVFIIYSDISDAVYKDSPLVVEKSNITIGVFASWALFKNSF